MQETVKAPGNAIEAVRHADPYPYYRRLREQQPLCFDPLLGLWVASSAEAVKAALANNGLRVRPASEPVPTALLGTAAADLFAVLVRMNDGPFHCAHKPEVIAAVEAVRLHQVANLAAAMAQALSETKTPNELLRQLPVRVMASALDVSDDRLDEMTRWIEGFSRGIAAGPVRMRLTRQMRPRQLCWTTGSSAAVARCRRRIASV